MPDSVKVGELSASDSVLLAKARANVEQAQQTFQFVGNHLAELYELTATQAILPNGDITDYRLVEPTQVEETGETTASVDVDEDGG